MVKKKKSERTRDKILKTFFELGSKDLTRLPNASEICDALDINRSTFYNHFSGIDELVDIGFNSVYAELEKKTLPILAVWELYGRNDQVFRGTFLSILEYLMTRKDEMLVLLGPNIAYKYNFLDLMKGHWSLIFEKVPEEERSYIISFISEGIYGACYEWTKKGCITPVEEFSAMLADMLLRVVKNV